VDGDFKISAGIHVLHEGLTANVFDGFVKFVATSRTEPDARSLKMHGTAYGGDQAGIPVQMEHDACRVSCHECPQRERRMLPGNPGSSIGRPHKAGYPPLPGSSSSSGRRRTVAPAYRTASRVPYFAYLFLVKVAGIVTNPAARRTQERL